MSIAVVISRDHLYPAAALVSTLWVSLWQAFKVSGARGRAGIKYPQLYAEKTEAAASKTANIFNCTQRAHQNTLEYIPAIVTSTLIASIKHPWIAAGLCGGWSLARIPYTIGYSTGDPARRNLFGSSAFGGASWIGLMIAATWTVAELLLETA